MNPDEGHLLNEEARVKDEFQCPFCSEWVDGFAAIDPIIIEAEPCCDICAAKLTNLKS